MAEFVMEGTVVIKFQNQPLAEAIRDALNAGGTESYAGVTLHPHRQSRQTHKVRVYTSQDGFVLLLLPAKAVTEEMLALSKMGKIRGLWPQFVQEQLAYGASIEQLEARNSDPSWPCYDGSVVSAKELLKR